MPSIGPTEIILVLVIALLVLGPTKLPELGRQLGRGIRQFREAARNVTKEMGAEDLVEDLKGLNEARGTFGQTVRKELGLDELGPFPDLDEAGKDKPATAAQTAAVTADVLVANAAVEATAAATPVAPAEAEAPVYVTEAPAADAAVETTPDVTAAAVKATAPRKRTPKVAAVATPATESKAAPRKRTPKAPVGAAPADEPSTGPAAAPARPARKRTVKADPSETA
jgi:TatA/E family protein of Tat protein translocase